MAWCDDRMTLHAWLDAQVYDGTLDTATDVLYAIEKARRVSDTEAMATIARHRATLDAEDLVA